MTDTTLFIIGADASCREGFCGEVSRVVLDPDPRMVTHLVVEPKHREGHGRLVPLNLVEVSNGEIHIRATAAEYDPAPTTYFPRAKLQSDEVSRSMRPMAMSARFTDLSSILKIIT